MLGVAIPEEFGGLGFGLFELSILLEQHGRSVAPIPLLPTLAMGALPIIEFGSDEQKSQILPKVTSGQCILTGAFQEWGINNPLNTSLNAELIDSRWHLTGSKPAVPSAENADYFVVSAQTAEDQISLFLVTNPSKGITIT